MISLLIIMRDGRAIETSTIGKGGVFGAPATFGLYNSRVRAIIQVQMTAAIIPAAVIRKHGETSKALQLLCMKYNETLLAHARVTAACNALHRVEERFCRWLLQTSSVTTAPPSISPRNFSPRCSAFAERLSPRWRENFRMRASSAIREALSTSST
jgi:CRP-like cAMP-binding protein